MHTSLSQNITLIETIQQTCKGTVLKQQKKQYKKKEIMLLSSSLLDYTYWNVFVGTSQSNPTRYILVQFFCFVCQFFSPRSRLLSAPQTACIIYVYSHSDTWWQHCDSLLWAPLSCTSLLCSCTPAKCKLTRFLNDALVTSWFGCW